MINPNCKHYQISEWAKNQGPGFEHSCEFGEISNICDVNDHCPAKGDYLYHRDRWTAVGYIDNVGNIAKRRY